jgi:hypothetical protein
MPIAVMRGSLCLACKSSSFLRNSRMLVGVVRIPGERSPNLIHQCCLLVFGARQTSTRLRTFFVPLLAVGFVFILVGLPRPETSMLLNSSSRQQFVGMDSCSRFSCASLQGRLSLRTIPEHRLWRKTSATRVRGWGGLTPV